MWRIDVFEPPYKKFWLCHCSRPILTTHKAEILKTDLLGTQFQTLPLGMAVRHLIVTIF